MDYTLDVPEEVTKTDSNSSETEAYLNSYLPRNKKHDAYEAQCDDKKQIVKKISYCQEWMCKEEGISTENEDAPPSLYDSTVCMTDSLLDVTSISRNVPPKDLKLQPKTGRGIKFDQYHNTKFM